ncbi:hypothetical protein GRX03_04895 [Halovenus sp. WSH3]|uniref:Lipoprotein n=1 Tax=Halovenus carboxidivorans TaxID=2692199 RepID=A0A6B0SZK3_9EURY|nr:hypothetical protein [Halovenus carboxidivorans]MXR50945.1 hypothetical protein [Halovenus carboxidivorans]
MDIETTRRSMLVLSAAVTCGFSGCSTSEGNKSSNSDNSHAEETNNTEDTGSSGGCDIELRRKQGEAPPIETVVSDEEYESPCITGATEAAYNEIQPKLPEEGTVTGTSSFTASGGESIIRIIIFGECRRSNIFADVVSITPESVLVTVLGESGENRDCRTEIYVEENIEGSD